MQTLQAILNHCDQRLRTAEIADFPGAENGLQVENNGTVRKIGAAVDAGLEPFRRAVEAGVDFLIVHHGLFWAPPFPISGSNREKIALAIENNLAVYSAHLPLDAHPEIGNNAEIAKLLKLSAIGSFLPYEGTDIGLLAKGGLERETLRERLETAFPRGVTTIEFGSGQPESIAILSGSGRSAIPELKKTGTDTLITGELRQEHFNQAQELGLNLYICGHYATETLGVSALAKELSEAFGLPWEFLRTDCPL